MPQRPGALKEFLELLGPEEDITRFEYLKKTARDFGTVLIGIETSAPKKIDLLLNRIKIKGFDYTDITDDETLSKLLISSPFVICLK